MGCGSSAHMTAVTSDNVLKPSPSAVINSSPKDKITLSDLPELNEEAAEVLKEDDHFASSFSNEKDTLVEAGGVGADSDRTDMFEETENAGSPLEIVQCFIDDNVSFHSQKSMQNKSDEKLKVNDNFELSERELGDADSFGTSSAESEIEAILSNNQDPQPATPKPNLLELQDIVMLTEAANDYVNLDNNENIVNPGSESNKKLIATKLIKNSTYEEENDVEVMLNQPTDWEKQADALAKTRKFNPIEAMRKLKRENRSSSSLPHRGDFRPKSQRNYEEDLAEFSSTYSPARSDLSSAKSERHVKGKLIETDTKDWTGEVKINDKVIVVDKVHESSISKPIEGKRKENNLLVPNTKKIVTSPCPYKVRERCAVCYNKYKQ